MGDPKKTKKKYFTPRHPWIKENIEAERELVNEFSFKRKKEIYKLNSILKKFKDRAKVLISNISPQGEKEKQQLMKKLQKLGLLASEAALDNVLGLTNKDIMGRRLQNLVFKKGLARTQSQARQFIVHQHIMVGNKKVTAPNYLVSQAEEDLIMFYPKSKFSNADHPERTIEKKEQLPVRPAPDKAPVSKGGFRSENKNKNKAKHKKEIKIIKK